MTLTSKHHEVPNLAKIETALISVSDKTGIVDLAKSLADRGIKLVSTGGTAKAIADAGISVSDVSSITNFPEIMDGRVKTLHPAVHGGLLGVRTDQTHRAAMKEQGISPIDMAIINLYPFEETIASNSDYNTCVENIDIGGPAMIRAAAKNHGFVTTVVDPDDYPELLEQLDSHKNHTSLELR
ncbi:MAG: bifunctional phosphoribosylaminoimidazolecarboxamide formyltransferase/IMP cyclohydrolase, partial [Pseudomonadota bacterium]